MSTGINEALREVASYGRQSLTESSRKDYRATADAIKTSAGGVPENASDEHKAGHAAARTHIAHLMADQYGRENPRFDRQQFLDAALK